MTMKKNIVDCLQMNDFIHELMSELKVGPHVFVHGPEFWLLFPWLLWMFFMIFMFGGKRK